MKKSDWQDNKESITKELAKLEVLNWAADPKVAETIFPYVLIEAINLLENCTLVPNPTDLTSTGEDTNKLLERIME